MNAVLIESLTLVGEIFFGLVLPAGITISRFFDIQDRYDKCHFDPKENDRIRNPKIRSRWYDFFRSSHWVSVGLGSYLSWFCILSGMLTWDTYPAIFFLIATGYLVGLSWQEQIIQAAVILRTDTGEGCSFLRELNWRAFKFGASGIFLAFLLLGMVKIFFGQA